MIQKYADLMEDLKTIRTVGLPPGMSTGWARVNDHFRPQKGYFCVLTGIPGHGKSEFFDCLMVNTIWLHQWRWAIFSPENYPTALHFIKLGEKFMGKKHSEATDSDYKGACKIIDEYATWIYPEQEDISLDEILETVKQVKDTYGLDAFVLDPWNEITRPRGISETDYIEEALRKFRRFCRENELFGTIIAHPTKMQPNRDGKMPAINLWSISGSAHWRNKADYGLVVHREDMTKNEPTLDVQKIKQKNFGRVGKVQLYYDYKSGLMKDDLHGNFELPKG